MASSLTHAQRVTRLYRRSLQHLLSWAIDRATWRQEALKLRARFDSNANIGDLKRATQLLQYGEEEFELNKHPDPYISDVMTSNTMVITEWNDALQGVYKVPTSPDGSKWERNLPIPPQILEMTPEEQQWYDEYMKRAPR